MGCAAGLHGVDEARRDGGQQAYNTFNMGIGMVFAVAPEEADKLVASLEENGEKAYRIGQVAKTGEDGERLVLL
ncbi:MAG: AIR synthase-related protein [Christensenellales bacterium]